MFFLRVRQAPSPVTPARPDRRGRLSYTLEHRFANDFFDGGNTVFDFNQSAAAEADHPDLRLCLLDVDGRAAGEDELANLVVDAHHFDQAHAPLVAGVVALLTTSALEDLKGTDFFFLVADVHQRLRLDVDRLLAVRTDAACEPLRGDELHRRGDQKRLDSHVHQTIDRRRRVVRVQRREDEMSGERRLDRDLRRFEVADLADEDDVRILPEKGAQRRREVQADRLLHLHLIDARQVELDRILRGHDVHFRRVHLRECGVERVRLPRSRRTGDEHHAPRLEDRLLELRERLRLEAELRHVEAEVVLVEQTKDDLLSEQRRQNRDAEVELFVLVLELHLQLDASVLREALLGDVELRQNLHARGDRVPQFEGRIHDLVQDAVDAEPYAILLLVRLDVNVGCAALDRVGENEVAQFDDGRFFRRIGERVDVELFLFLEDLQVRILLRLKIFHDLLQLERGGRSVVVVDRGLDAELGGDDRLDVVARHELDVVHGEHVRRIRHRDRDRRAGLVDGKDVVLPRDVTGDQLDDAGVDLEVLEIDGRHSELLRQALGNVLLGHEPELDERLTELSARLFLDAQGLFELILRDQIRLRQQLTQPNAHRPP